jgi:hypothetical protein
VRWLGRTVGCRLARPGSVGGLSTLRGTGTRRDLDSRQLHPTGLEAICRERPNTSVWRVHRPHGAEKGHRPLGLNGELGTEGPVQEH